MLEVEFTNGRVYSARCPESEYQSLMQSESPGSYFARNLKRVYLFTEV